MSHSTAAATTPPPGPDSTEPTILAKHHADAGEDNAMNHVTLDKPWHRPGAAAYARKRRRAALHPPITVYEMPADVTKEEDVPVQMRDG